MNERDATLQPLTIKIAVWVAVIAGMVLDGPVTTVDTTLFLVGIIMEVLAARWPVDRGSRRRVATVAKAATFVALAVAQPVFLPVIVSAVFDLSRTARPTMLVGMAVAILSGAAVIGVAVLPGVVPWTTGSPREAILLGMSVVIAAATGRCARRFADDRRAHIQALDAERTVRHHLEAAQQRLEVRHNDVVRLTEQAERARIAHTIHDDVGHRLSGVLMQLQAVRTLSQAHPERAKTMLDSSVTALREVSSAIREAVYDLRPLPTAGPHAIRRLCTTFRPCPVRLTLDDPQFERLTAPVRRCAVASVEELLNNTMRHAHATEVSLLIAVDRDDDTMHRGMDAARSDTVASSPRRALRLVYRDDGVGATKVREGVGLTGVRARVERLGGTFVYTGHAGFAVHIEVPEVDEPHA